MIQILIERDGKEIPVTVEIKASWDSGVYLESNHPVNGYGAGWIIERVAAKDKEGNSYKLTPDEVAEAWEKKIEEESEYKKL